MRTIFNYNTILINRCQYPINPHLTFVYTPYLSNVTRTYFTICLIFLYNQ